jgi:hypothetical protein
VEKRIEDMEKDEGKEGHHQRKREKNYGKASLFASSALCPRSEKEKGRKMEMEMEKEKEKEKEKEEGGRRRRRRRNRGRRARTRGSRIGAKLLLTFRFGFINRTSLLLVC